jgi:hypothetical protein
MAMPTTQTPYYTVLWMPLFGTKISADQPADTRSIMAGRALGMAGDVLREYLQWHDEHSHKAGEAIAAVEHSLKTWWPPDSDK